MTTGEKIKKYRTESNKTLEEIAQYIGVSRQTLSRYETGIIQNIPSDKLEGIARILHIHPSLLMHWTVKWEPDYYSDYRKAKSASEKIQMLNNWGIPSDLVAEADLLLFGNEPSSKYGEGFNPSDFELLRAIKNADEKDLKAIRVILGIE